MNDGKSSRDMRHETCAYMSLVYMCVGMWMCIHMDVCVCVVLVFDICHVDVSYVISLLFSTNCDTDRALTPFLVPGNTSTLQCLRTSPCYVMLFYVMCLDQVIDVDVGY